MSKARVQPFPIANIINIGYFSGEEVYPRSATERIKALYSCNRQFRLLWKSDVVFKLSYRRVEIKIYKS